MSRNSSSLPIGKYLRQKRESLGITQGFIASKLGYSSPQFVSNWERGICGPPVHDMKKVKKLIRILEIEPADYIERVLLEQRKRLEKGLAR